MFLSIIPLLLQKILGFLPRNYIFVVKLQNKPLLVTQQALN